MGTGQRPQRRIALRRDGRPKGKRQERPSAASIFGTALVPAAIWKNPRSSVLPNRAGDMDRSVGNGCAVVAGRSCPCCSGRAPDPATVRLSCGWSSMSNPAGRRALTRGASSAARTTDPQHSAAIASAKATQPGTKDAAAGISRRDRAWPLLSREDERRRARITARGRARQRRGSQDDDQAGGCRVHQRACPIDEAVGKTADGRVRRQRGARRLVGRRRPLHFVRNRGGTPGQRQGIARSAARAKDEVRGRFARIRSVTLPVTPTALQRSDRQRDSGLRAKAMEDTAPPRSSAVARSMIRMQCGLDDRR